ncbi:hypothetical protein RF11_14597 [Thelohanellus kitauei]|uniref:Gamma-soluble NSF attachment protein n=1 Tax=Thelohanellus kitauei TaxID=669202 RepID=A0A0C2NAB6_THEKT|nr:hypothetical protein RF11_14597 [Thelohanellus kitauei]
MPYFKAVARYQQAAKCFLRLKDSRAIICFQKSIDAFLKDYRYKQAIERLFVYGYLCQREFTDGDNGKEFYKKAEELSLKYKKTHSCVITQFEESEYEGNYEKALDDHQKNKRLLNILRNVLKLFNVKLSAGIVSRRFINYQIIFLIPHG